MITFEEPIFSKRGNNFEFIVFVFLYQLQGCTCAYQKGITDSKLSLAQVQVLSAMECLCACFMQTDTG